MSKIEWTEKTWNPVTGCNQSDDLAEILASQKNEAIATTGCKSFGQQGL